MCSSPRYRLSVYSNRGCDDFNMADRESALQIASLLFSNCDEVDEVQVWDMDKVDADGDPDANVIYENQRSRS